MDTFKLTKAPGFVGRLTAILPLPEREGRGEGEAAFELKRNSASSRRRASGFEYPNDIRVVVSRNEMSGPSYRQAPRDAPYSKGYRNAMGFVHKQAGAKVRESMKAVPNWIMVLYALALFAVAAGGAWFYTSQRRAIEQEAEADLTAISELKSSEIAAWRANQIGEGEEVTGNRVLLAEFARWLAQPGAEAPGEVREFLSCLWKHYHYQDLLVADLAGRVRLSFTGRTASLSEETARVLHTALASHQIVLGDLERDESDVPCLDVVAPLAGGDAAAPQPFGALLLRSDARRFLFPLIQSWPRASQTAETLLVRRDGDTVLFLNELRHRHDTALKLRIPLARMNVPAVMAVTGKEGVVRGQDYRGVEVLSVLKPIADSPWFMVAKVDAAEALAGWRIRGAMILALAAGLMALGFAGGLTVWQRNAKAYYRSLLRAETARLQAEARYRITLMSVGDAVISTDLEGRVELLNPAAEVLTGWPQAEARGRPIEGVFQIVNEDTGLEAENPIRRVMREGAVASLANHTFLIARDGARRPIADAAAPIRDGGGAITGSVLVFRDQTREREAQRALHESKARLDTALQAARMGAWSLDLARNRRDFDERTCIALGIDFSEFTGAPEAFYERVHPEDRESIKAVLARAVQRDGPYETDFRVIWPDGSLHYVSSRATIERNGDGRPIRLNGVLWDASERKRAEEEIGRSRAELEAIYEGTPIMMCVVNRKREVERINRALAEFIDCGEFEQRRHGPGDLLGCVNALDSARGCGSGSECHDCPLRKAVLDTFLTGRPCRHVESRMVLARGSARRGIEVSASTALVQTQGEPKVIVCIEDVTARRQLESQLLQAQKMDAVGQLAGGIAHDFNNILAASLLHLQLLQERPGLDPEIRAQLKELEESTQRAGSLTRQLLLFSRRQVMQTKRIDLNPLLAELAKMLRRLLGEAVALDFKPSPVPAWVEADPGMIEQVVMNLCVNARDAMAGGGSLSVALGTVEVAPAEIGRHPESRAGRFVRLTVADDGCGMDEATLERVFEPFFTTKEQGKGTGLGLSTVYGIARQHQGWVEVQSTPGRGSTFSVFLPASAPATPRASIPLAAPPRRGTETILLVEDDDQLRGLISFVLRNKGYRVVEAVDGVDAARKWEAGGGASLLFSDMIMPGGVTGIDLAERFRHLKPGLPVIISSGYSADLLKRGEFSPRGMHFLSKPYDMETLAAVVRNCLDATPWPGDSGGAQLSTAPSAAPGRRDDAQDIESGSGRTTASR